VDKRPRKLNEFEKLENLLQFKGACEKLSMQFNIDAEEYLGGEVEVIVPCLLGKWSACGVYMFLCLCVYVFMCLCVCVCVCLCVLYVSECVRVEVRYFCSSLCGPWERDPGLFSCVGLKRADEV
jgi:hypothetical protein